MKSDSVAWAKLSLLFEVQMKIVVFADLHGNITAAERAVQLSFDEKADKTVFCGDIFGVWGSAQEIAEKLQQVCGIAYFVRGNNDFSCYDGYIAGGLEEYAVMYHFGRTLFFTHGDRYNGGRVPPVLKQGDVLVHGHTHVANLTVRNGLFVLNVGSLARPRDGKPSYLVLDDHGATTKDIEGNALTFLSW